MHFWDSIIFKHFLWSAQPLRPLQISLQQFGVSEIFCGSLICWFYWSCWPVKQNVKIEPCINAVTSIFILKNFNRTNRNKYISLEFIMFAVLAIIATPKIYKLCTHLAVQQHCVTWAYNVHTYIHKYIHVQLHVHVLSNTPSLVSAHK